MCFGDWFAQTAQLGQKQRPSVVSGSTHSTPLPRPSKASIESLHQQWMESFSEALVSCMESMSGLSAEETQTVSVRERAYIPHEFAGGTLTQCHQHTSLRPCCVVW